MTRSSRRWLAAGALCVTTVLGLACSSDDDGSSSTTTVADGRSDDGSTTTTTTLDGGSTGGADEGPTDGTGEPGETDSPSVDLTPLPAVALGEASDFGSGLLATVTKVESVALEAQRPGETGGPGVIVTVELQNDTGDPVDLSAVSVNATYGSGTPAVPHQTAPVTPFAGTLAPGAKSTGTYAFRVPADQERTIVVDVHHADQVNYVIVDVGEAVQ